MENTTITLTTILIFLISFIFVREFWTWYFKINKLVQILEKIEQLILLNVENKPKNTTSLLESMNEKQREFYERNK